jgi:hypothetical protein
MRIVISNNHIIKMRECGYIGAMKDNDVNRNSLSTNNNGLKK